MIHFSLTAVVLMMFMLASCQATGEIVNLKIVKFQESSEAGSSSLKIIVRPFEDHRSNKHVVIAGSNRDENFSTGFSEAVVDFLRHKGLNAKAEGLHSNQEVPDITLSGKVRELTANSKSRLGSTLTEAKILIEFKAKNTLDDSSVWITVAASEANTDVLYSQERVNDLVNKVLQEVFLQFFEGTEIHGKILKRKI